MTEIVNFLDRSHLIPKSQLNILQTGLFSGRTLSTIMQDLGFSTSVVTQLSLAEKHGNLLLSLAKIENHLVQLMKVRKKLIEVGTYPIILLCFLVAIMLGLKSYLLPQMGASNLATFIIGHLPNIFLISIGVVLVGILCFSIWYRRCSKIMVWKFLVNLPVVRSWIQLYQTAYYAREWGTLMGQGLEMSVIFSIMKTQSNELFREMGIDLEEALHAGITFEQQLKKYPFFTPELSLIVEYGQAKSKLGNELDFYAQSCWDKFFYKVNQGMQLVQPIIFIFVALIIVLIYAAMLLPIYQSMDSF